MQTSYQKNKKGGVALLIFLSLTVSITWNFWIDVPVARAVVPVHDPVNWFSIMLSVWRDSNNDLAKHMARIAMRTVARIIRNKIIYGNDGRPAFVTNWRNFSRRNQDTGSVVARKLLGEAVYGVNDDAETAVVCEYLRDPIGLAFLPQHIGEDFAEISRAYRIDSEQTFKLRAQCTLPKTVVVNGVEKPFDIEAYRQNFEGGWEVFEKLFEPQNNFFGLSSLVAQEVARQRESEERFALNEATAGGGYLSLKNPLGQIKTPASYVRDIAGSTANSALNCLETIDTSTELRVCVSQVVKDIVFGHLENFRNIADDFGLLDDSAGEQAVPQECDPSNATCVDDPANLDDLVKLLDEKRREQDEKNKSEASAECTRLCNDSANSTCSLELPENKDQCIRDAFNACVRENSDICGQ